MTVYPTHGIYIYVTFGNIELTANADTYHNVEAVAFLSTFRSLQILTHSDMEFVPLITFVTIIRRL